QGGRRSDPRDGVRVPVPAADPLRDAVRVPGEQHLDQQPAAGELRLPQPGAPRGDHPDPPRVRRQRRPVRHAPVRARDRVRRARGGGAASLPAAAPRRARM
ncbi:MAG: hypothetical protein AVDCRST_MAG40-1852, partial [uncultured Gemmatimonadaceae bacterium]